MLTVDQRLALFFTSTVKALIIKMITSVFLVLAHELEDYNYDYFKIRSLILQSCNISCGKPSDYSYISELQEELILR